MAIRYFFLGIFVLCILGYFANQDTKNLKYSNETRPVFVFDNSTLYTFKNNKITQMMHSLKAKKFKYRSELYKVNALIKNKQNTVDRIDSDNVYLSNSFMIFKNNVVASRGDFVKFKTKRLFYKIRTGLAYNYDYFSGHYYNYMFKGISLHVDTKDDIIRAAHVHFELSGDDKDKKNK